MMSIACWRGAELGGVSQSIRGSQWICVGIQQPIRIGAVVLAAETSSRMGEPKQLLRLGERTVLEQTLENLRNVHVQQIVLVLGFAAATIRRQLAFDGIKVVVNNQFRDGMGVVVKEALRALKDADLVQASLDLSEIKISPQSFIVVSTQGEDDEEALEAALNTGAVYVALVASKKKAGKLLDFLKERGLDTERVNRVRAPAGLDIQASSPEEIAVSILAEIIQERKPVITQPADNAALPVLKLEASDPILWDDG